MNILAIGIGHKLEKQNNNGWWTGYWRLLDTL